MRREDLARHALIVALIALAALSAALIALAALVTGRTAPAHTAEGVEVEVVLLLGQSNMVGFDTTAPAMPFDSRVWFWTGHLDGTWWWQAFEPLHGVGYGPGTDFGKHLVTIRPDVRSVMLIPCAVGGTTADRWAADGDLYTRCLALAGASGLRPTGALVYQGESDAAAAAGADAWADRFADLVGGLRDEYGEIPVVYAQIGQVGPPNEAAFPHWARLRDAQDSVSLPRVAMVRTDDLPVFDGLHLTWHSEMTLGQRMARAYAGLLP